MKPRRPLTIQANGSTIKQTCPFERVLGHSSSTALLISGATVTGGSGVVSGGGINSAGPVTLTNSTVSGNSAAGTGGGLATNATIANNTVGNGTTGVRTPLTLQSFGSVIGSGTGGVPCAISAGTNTQGYNFEQGANTCGFGAGAGDVVNGPDPLLLALGDNGGMTNTMLFATLSPLKNAIPLANPACTGTDQRGFTRPQGAGCDIGAVEMRVPVAINGNVTTDAGVSVTVDLHNFVTDPDGWLAGATYTVGPQAATGFADAIGAGEVVYSPNPGFAGSDSYGYQVCDSQKVTCIGATIFVTVNGVAAVPPQPIVAAPAFAG